MGKDHHTGFHTIQSVNSETGELTRVVSATATVTKTIAGIITSAVVIFGAIFGAVRWGMNTSAEATIEDQLKNPDSELSRKIHESNEELAAEIVADVDEMYENLRDQIQTHHDDTRRAIWKATNPARRPDSGEPPEEDD